MNYEPRILDMTIEEINAELDRMSYEEYAYGKAIDRPHLWDLLATKKKIEKEG